MHARDHAVVVGAGFAGLTAARVLTEFFDRVTLVERDVLPDGPEPRRGIPQGTHLHGLLMLGREILDELFPGYGEEVVERGGGRLEFPGTVAVFTPDGWRPRGRTNIEVVRATRPLLELVVSRRVREDAQVDLRQGTSVAGLVVRSGRVAGLDVRAEGAGEERLEADLVVDASGRGSRAPRWLEAHGFAPPEETVIHPFLGYASRLVRVPEEAWPGDIRGVHERPWLGVKTRGAALIEQDGGRHIVTLIGQGRDYPSTDEDAFAAWLSDCRTPLLAEIVARAEPVTPITATRTSANVRRHYERLDRRARGFVAVGDSVCAFNPVYGQGMSTAAVAARTLRETLAALDGDLDRLVETFPGELARANEVPWNMATSADLGWPETVVESGEPSATDREAAAFLAEVGRMAAGDLYASAVITHAAHTFRGELLFSEEMRGRLARWNEAGRPGSPHTDPRRPPPPSDEEVVLPLPAAARA